MKENVPPVWATAMIEAGFTDGRFHSTEQDPSIAKLGIRCRELFPKGGPSDERVRRLIMGLNKRPRQDTIHMVQSALGVTDAHMDRLLAASDQGSVGRVYAVPDEMALLTAQQQRAVNRIVVLFAEANRKEEVSADAPPMTQDEMTLAADAAREQAQQSSREGGQKRGTRRKRTDE